MPPHLNHQGPDICRGLLTFARKKRLGERGWFWLKVQLANLAGKDKLRIEDRVKYSCTLAVDSKRHANRKITKSQVGQSVFRSGRRRVEGIQSWLCVDSVRSIYGALSLLYFAGGPKTTRIESLVSRKIRFRRRASSFGGTPTTDRFSFSGDVSSFRTRSRVPVGPKSSGADLQCIWLG